MPTHFSQVNSAKQVFALRLNARLAHLGMTFLDIQTRSAAEVLAGRLKRGINRTLLYRYADGSSLPTQGMLEALAHVLSCTPDDLLPPEYTRTTKPGRPPSRHKVMLLKTQNYQGLERVRLQLDVVMPTKAAMALRRTMEQYAKKSGMEIVPPPKP